MLLTIVVSANVKRSISLFIWTGKSERWFIEYWWIIPLITLLACPFPLTRFLNQDIPEDPNNTFDPTLHASLHDAPLQSHRVYPLSIDPHVLCTCKRSIPLYSHLISFTFYVVSSVAFWPTILALNNDDYNHRILYYSSVNSILYLYFLRLRQW